VIASHNSCTDTSDCIVIDQLGLSELSTTELKLYPNPVSSGECLTIVSDARDFVIQSLDGKIVQPVSLLVLDGKCEIKLPILSNGVYLIKENGEANPRTSRFTVN
jgi:hypothetical protein